MQENKLLEEQCSHYAQCQQVAISQPENIRRLRNFCSLLNCSFNFLGFYALLSFWSLICNAEFDSNFSCLDRLNNFGTASSQKLQNFSQNAISRLVETLMCQSG